MRCVVACAVLISAFILNSHAVVPERQEKADCLQTLDGPASDAVFDRQFDHPWDGGSFSCDLATRASNVKRALDDLRAGVLYGDRAALRRVMRFPVEGFVYKSLAFGEKPTTTSLKNDEAVAAFVRTHFSRRHFALVACSSVLNADIVKSRTYGFFFGESFILLQQMTDQPRPQVVQIRILPDDGREVRRFCTGGDAAHH